MTKRDLAIRISDETGLRQLDALAFLQKVLDHILKALAEGETLEFRNFGVFEIVIRKPRIGRNPNAPGKDVRIPTRAVVKFTAGKDMRKAVLKLTPRSKKA